MHALWPNSMSLSLIIIESYSTSIPSSSSTYSVVSLEDPIGVSRWTMVELGSLGTCCVSNMRVGERSKLECLCTSPCNQVRDY